MTIGKTGGKLLGLDPALPAAFLSPAVGSWRQRAVRAKPGVPAMRDLYRACPATKKPRGEFTGAFCEGVSATKSAAEGAAP